MPVYSYNLTNGDFRWYFIVDLPKGHDGKRQQVRRGGFVTQAAAQDAEASFLDTYGRVEKHADGTVAAELEVWLSDRVLDVEVETYDNYHCLFHSYVIPYLGDRQIYTIDKNVLHGLYTNLLAGFQYGRSIGTDPSSDPDTCWGPPQVDASAPVATLRRDHCRKPVPACGVGSCDVAAHGEDDGDQRSGECVRGEQ